MVLEKCVYGHLSATLLLLISKKKGAIDYYYLILFYFFLCFSTTQYYVNIIYCVIRCFLREICEDFFFFKKIYI